MDFRNTFAGEYSQNTITFISYPLRNFGLHTIEWCDEFSGNYIGTVTDVTDMWNKRTKKVNGKLSMPSPIVKKYEVPLERKKYCI